MDATRTAAVAPAQIAKGALRRLAMAKQEPTPVNYARAYAEESGEPAAANPGPAWAQVIDRLVRALERGGRNWTGARKKDSLQRVLNSSRSDALRLQQRLGQLITAWDSDQPDVEVDALKSAAAAPAAEPRLAPAAEPRVALAAMAQAITGPEARAETVADTAQAAPPDAHPRIVHALQTTLCAGLPADEPRAAELADDLATLSARVAYEGATPALADEVAAVCQRAQRLLGLRQELVSELLALCGSLGDGLSDLAEDGSWAQGQGQALRQRLDGGQSARAVRAARELLDDTRLRQRALQTERVLARDALKQIVREVLSGLGDLSGATGRFSDKVQGYAQSIESAESLESLSAVVQGLLGESQAVHKLVASTRERLDDEHARASALDAKVQGLESELRRLSDEVSTDALTQVANRRGLAQAFAQEKARAERDGSDAAPLAVGLIDIDNFKKLNDSLGHAAGDVALQNLAARVREWLRPIDHVARFGGEEFVVLLPGTPAAEGQQVLTRLQRRLSASLFMHEGREVFVTFSAGISAWQPDETLETVLGRADEGLYEAKRSGKNRTCVA